MLDQPDRMVMALAGLGRRDCKLLAGQALANARRLAPKLTGNSANRMEALYGEGWIGIRWVDKQVWFQERGVRPFTMTKLAGKLIPMWIDDPTGTERQKNPKAKKRVTASGKTQVLIFRKAAKIGARRMIKKNDAFVNVPACYDDQTEVLTYEGYKAWGEVGLGDLFMTLNPFTGAMEYQQASILTRQYYEGPMIRVISKHVDLLVTEDHRMWVASDLRSGFRIELASECFGRSRNYQITGEWKGEEPEVFVVGGFEQNRGGRWTKTVDPVPVDAEVWFQFLGLYLSEGTTCSSKGSYKISICQSPGPKQEWMRGVLDRLPWHFGDGKRAMSCCSDQLYRALDRAIAVDKRIPQYVKDASPRLLLRFIEAYQMGDGDKQGIYTSSIGMRDDLVEVALKAGLSARYVLHRPKGTRFVIAGVETASREHSWLIYLNNTHLTPMVDCSPRHTACALRDDYGYQRVDYNGEIFCASVPNGLLFVRRSGKPIVCGNSYPGAPGRIAIREAGKPYTTVGKVGGQIAKGNVGVRWRFPGMQPRKFLEQGLLMSAYGHGLVPGPIHAVTESWRGF